MKKEPKQKNVGQLTTYSKKAPPKRDHDPPAPEPKKEKKKRKEKKKVIPPPPPVEEPIIEEVVPEPEPEIKADSTIYECEHCGQVFGSQSWLTRHLKESHP